MRSSSVLVFSIFCLVEKEDVIIRRGMIVND